MVDEGLALDLAEIDRLMGAWLDSVEYAPDRFLPGEMPDVDDAELMEKGDRSAAGRKAALARWGNRGPVNDSVRAKRSDAARRAAATRRANKEEAASGGGPETEAQAAARMGAEFKAKRGTNEPIAAVDEIAGKKDYEEFIRRNAAELDLGKGEEFILQDACMRIVASNDRNKETYNGLSPAERANALDVATQFSKRGTVMVATPPEVALRILSGDRAKSQFETGTSKGFMDPDVRATAETKMYKVHPGMDPEERHTYGYVSLKNLKDTADSGLSGGDTALGPARYGSIRFRLAPSVNERTGITLGDSLGSPATPIRMGTTPTDRQAVSAVGHSGGEPYRGDIGRLQRDSYVEAQISGGWSSGDVTRVYVPAGQNEDVVSAATEAGIEVVRYSY
jgi:hypothetical protein